VGRDPPIALGSSSTIDSDFSCPSQPYGKSHRTTSCRWGDYAGASVDPSNANVVWGSNQLNGPTGASTEFGHSAQWATRNFALQVLPSPHVYKNGVIGAEGAKLRTLEWGVLKLTNPALGEVECHSIWAGYLENPAGSGAAVGFVQAFFPYECVSESCKALGATAIEVTAEKLPWSAEVVAPGEGVFRMKTGNRTKAAGAIFVRVNCVGAKNVQFFGENAPKLLNNGLAAGSAPGEGEFDQPGSGELESEALGGLKFAGNVKVEGYGQEELIEVKAP
jgi:hypothetical protein